MINTLLYISSSDTLNSCLSETLNVLAPLTSLTITEKLKHDWYNAECSENRRHLRNIE